MFPDQWEIVTDSASKEEPDAEKTASYAGGSDVPVPPGTPGSPSSEDEACV